MSIIYVMIPLAILLVVGAVWALVWAIRSGQFDELDSQGWSPVLDDDSRPAGTHTRASGQDDSSQQDSGQDEGAGPAP